MAVLLVTYDLNKPGQNHSKVLEYIKGFAAWARLSESCYAIKTDLSPGDVCGAIRKLMDNNDHVYIITLSRPYSGFGPKEVNEWLESNLLSAYFYAA